MSLDDQNDERPGIARCSGDIVSDLAEAAVNYSPEEDPDEPRDPWWLRWLKFASIIVFPAFLVGAIFFGAGFWWEYEVARHSVSTAIDAPQDAVTNTLRACFETGAIVGGGLGLIYVVRCLYRRVDP